MLFIHKLPPLILTLFLHTSSKPVFGWRRHPEQLWGLRRWGWITRVVVVGTTVGVPTVDGVVVIIVVPVADVVVPAVDVVIVVAVLGVSS